MSIPPIKKKILYRKSLAAAKGKLSEPYRYQEQYFAEDERLIRKIIFNNSGEIIRDIVFKYDPQKRLTSERHEMLADVLKKIYSYNENGQIAEIKLYKNEELQSQMIYTYVADDQYDEIIISKGRRVRQKHYDSEDCLQWEVNLTSGQQTNYEYDKKNNIIAIKKESEEGSINIDYQNHYDEHDRLTKVGINSNLSISYSYNSYGLLKKERQYSSARSVEEEIEYEYEFY